MTFAKYRARLPQRDNRLFLTDGGLETTLIFHDKIDLPHFAAFDLLRTREGRERLRRYYERYIDIARARGTGFILESATWRASADWAEKLGYSPEALVAVNRDAIELMAELRDAHAKPGLPMVISGCIGPRGDGYVAGQLMRPDEAAAYHGLQVRVFADSAADMVSAVTMTNADEAVGITRAAQAHNIPVVISFTLETDGALPTGQSLRDAVAEVDAATGNGPAYYMINCAHPTHFTGMLAEGGAWLSRLRGLRANASTRSHAELNEAPDLDAGNPAELGSQYGALLKRYPQFNVLGGCCGTDHRHVEHIGMACRAAA